MYLRQYFFIGLSSVFLATGSASARGSSSTGGGLPPTPIRFSCEGQRGDDQVRLTVLGKIHSEESHFFDVEISEVKAGVETLLSPPRSYVHEAVHVERRGIMLRYSSPAGTPFISLKVYPSEKTKDPIEGYAAQVAFDFSNGLKPIVVVPAICVANPRR